MVSIPTARLLPSANRPADPPINKAAKRRAAQRAVLPRFPQPNRSYRRVWAFVVTLIGIVHGLALPHAAGAGGAPRDAAAPVAGSSKSLNREVIEDLPIPVLEMRDAILIATRTGDIGELLTAIEWNELTPDFGLPEGTDPIARWRKESSDGEGREILAILANLLADRPVRLPIGRDLENNDVYVWPYLSELKPNAFTPAQIVDLYRLVPADVATQMLKGDTWTWYRLAIGADGTWHLFSKPKATAQAD